MSADIDISEVNPRLPASVMFVAVACLAYGSIFTTLAVFSLFTNHINIDLLALLCLFAGIGLVRRQRGWLVFLIWACRLMVGGAFLISVLAVVFPARVNIQLGSLGGNASDNPGMALLVLVSFAAAFVLVHWALTRPVVSLAFRKRASQLDAQQAIPADRPKTGSG